MTAPFGLKCVVRVARIQQLMREKAKRERKLPIERHAAWSPLWKGTYSPMIVPAVPVGPPVIVSPKVYVPGQPIRNFFRAITP